MSRRVNVLVFTPFAETLVRAFPTDTSVTGSSGSVFLMATCKDRIPARPLLGPEYCYDYGRYFNSAGHGRDDSQQILLSWPTSRECGANR